MRIVLCFIALCFLSTGLFGQGENKPKINTDRPSQTESAFSMPKGYFQWETGFTYTEGPGTIMNSSGAVLFTDIESFTFNTSSFRYGISDRIELRLIQSFGKDRTDIFSGETTFGPTFVGTKIELAKQKDGKPQVAFQAQVGTPVLESGSEGVQADFRFSFEHRLSDKLSFGYNLGGIVTSDELQINQNQSNFRGLYTVVLSYSVNPKLSVFGELFGFLEDQVEADHRIDLGLTYLVGPNFQLDLFTGTGFKLNSARNPDSILGFGFSLRIPKN